ncbi:MAG: N-acetylmuramoyl-L-alanine amidase, partial [Aureispira sp.]|nr:N-acetylmuramoyl-L-alanine amidase [Aureispira sp.]
MQLCNLLSIVEKSTIVALFLLVCLPFFSETASSKLKPLSRVFTIVIDAGHGGKDSGALGSIVKEKDIALKLALRLGQYIQEYMPSVQVLYTRTTDRFIPLHERIALANNNQADLFFSIHCNSTLTRSNTVSGTETYVMGLHGVAENLNVAKRENKAVLLEKDYVQNYGGYNPYSSEGHIMLSMYQNAYLSQSLLLAEKVEKQFMHTAKRKSRGVKQAGFLVLRTATMPSVLVETGFLSNSIEEH